MSKQACKCKEVECEECPEWIFTLADLIMCMMGLFVILWVLKPEGQRSAGAQGTMDPKLVETVAAIRDAFKYVPPADSQDPIDLEVLRRIRPYMGPGHGGRTPAERSGAPGDSERVESIRPGKDSTVGGRVLFEPGSADLGPEARVVLDEVVKLIRGHKNVMLVKGHASPDDFPDGAGAQAKLELSIRRAQAVADYLVAAGVEPEILRVLGCSTFEPVKVRAYAPDERRLNRRVEVESTTTLVAELQDRPATRPAAATPEKSGR